MSQKKTEEPETVELVNEYGSIARPMKEDEDVWLATGWKRVEQAKPIKE